MSNSQPASHPDSIDLDYDMWAGQFEFIGGSKNNIKQLLNNNNNNNNNISNCNGNNNDISDINNSDLKSDSLEDLNLNFNATTLETKLATYPNTNIQTSLNSRLSSNSVQNDRFGDINSNSNYLFGKQPILTDQEPFLSLNPGDFDDIVPSGPNSLILIENQLCDRNTNTNTNTTPAANDSDLEKSNNYNNNNNINNNNNNNTNNNKIVNFESVTNKFNNKTNNANTNTNGFKLENLKNFKNKLIGDFEEKNNSCIVVGVAVVGSTDEMPANNNENFNLNTVNGKMHELAAEICENFNEQLELLQRQVTDLADNKTISEDRTARTKTEYAVLQARYHMLEEQLRETELRAEERLLEEQKRYREMVARVEREAELQTENCQIKIRTIEIEANALREENQRLRLLCDKQQNDLHRTEEKLELVQDQIAILQQDLDETKQLGSKYEDEKKATEELIIQLSAELERLRAETIPAIPSTSSETIRLEELQQELEEMRQKNKSLEEQNEELQAVVLTHGVEEGRHLLNGTLNSLAQEFEEMSQAQASADSNTLASFNELKKAFQEKEEENTRLKHYIDTILLNIVENYPQLLEVKPIPAENRSSK